MVKNLKVCIIGAENWGSAIATAVCANVTKSSNFSEQVHIYVYDERVNNRKLSEIINDTRENIKYLPGITLPENLLAFSDLHEAAVNADVLIFATPKRFVKSYCNMLTGKLKSTAIAVSLIKGLDRSSDGEIQLFSHSIAESLEIPCYTLMSASNAMEMAQGKLCEVTIGCDDQMHTTLLSELLETKNCKVVAINDIEGVELCGTLKDIVALGAGIVDGLRMGENTRVTALHLGIKEMMRFVKEFYPSAKLSTFFECSGVADLAMSCYAADKNVRFAKTFVVSGKTIQEMEANILNGKKLLGPQTAEDVHTFLNNINQEAKYPLFTSIHKICQNEQHPETIISVLRHHPDLSNMTISELLDQEHILKAKSIAKSMQTDAKLESEASYDDERTHAENSGIEFIHNTEPVNEGDYMLDYADESEEIKLQENNYIGDDVDLKDNQAMTAGEMRNILNDRARAKSVKAIEMESEESEPDNEWNEEAVQTTNAAIKQPSDYDQDKEKLYSSDKTAWNLESDARITAKNSELHENPALEEPDIKAMEVDSGQTEPDNECKEKVRTAAKAALQVLNDFEQDQDELRSANATESNIENRKSQAIIRFQKMYFAFDQHQALEETPLKAVQIESKHYESEYKTNGQPVQTANAVLRQQNNFEESKDNSTRILERLESPKSLVLEQSDKLVDKEQHSNFNEALVETVEIESFHSESDNRGKEEVIEISSTNFGKFNNVEEDMEKLHSSADSARNLGSNENFVNEEQHPNVNETLALAVEIESEHSDHKGREEAIQITSAAVRQPTYIEENKDELHCSVDSTRNLERDESTNTLMLEQNEDQRLNLKETTMESVEIRSFYSESHNKSKEEEIQIASAVSRESNNIEENENEFHSYFDSARILDTNEDPMILEQNQNFDNEDQRPVVNEAQVEKLEIQNEDSVSENRINEKVIAQNYNYCCGAKQLDEFQQNEENLGSCNRTAVNIESSVSFKNKVLQENTRYVENDEHQTQKETTEPHNNTDERVKQTTNAALSQQGEIEQDKLLSSDEVATSKAHTARFEFPVLQNIEGDTKQDDAFCYKPDENELSSSGETAKNLGSSASTTTLELEENSNSVNDVDRQPLKEKAVKAVEIESEHFELNNKRNGEIGATTSAPKLLSSYEKDEYKLCNSDQTVRKLETNESPDVLVFKDNENFANVDQRQLSNVTPVKIQSDQSEQSKESSAELGQVIGDASKQLDGIIQNKDKLPSEATEVYIHREECRSLKETADRIDEQLAQENETYINYNDRQTSIEIVENTVNSSGEQSAQSSDEQKVSDIEHKKKTAKILLNLYFSPVQHVGENAVTDFELRFFDLERESISMSEAKKTSEEQEQERLTAAHSEATKENIQQISMECEEQLEHEEPLTQGSVALKTSLPELKLHLTEKFKSMAAVGTFNGSNSQAKNNNSELKEGAINTFLYRTAAKSTEPTENLGNMDNTENATIFSKATSISDVLKQRELGLLVNTEEAFFNLFGTDKKPNSDNAEWNWMKMIKKSDELTEVGAQGDLIPKYENVPKVTPTVSTTKPKQPAVKETPEASKEVPKLPEASKQVPRLPEAVKSVNKLPKADALTEASKAESTRIATQPAHDTDECHHKANDDLPLYEVSLDEILDASPEEIRLMELLAESSYLEEIPFQVELENIENDGMQELNESLELDQNDRPPLYMSDEELADVFSTEELQEFKETLELNNADDERSTVIQNEEKRQPNESVPLRGNEKIDPIERNNGKIEKSVKIDTANKKRTTSAALYADFGNFAESQAELPTPKKSAAYISTSHEITFPKAQTITSSEISNAIENDRLTRAQQDSKTDKDIGAGKFIQNNDGFQGGREVPTERFIEVPSRFESKSCTISKKGFTFGSGIKTDGFVEINLFFESNKTAKSDGTKIDRLIETTSFNETESGNDSKSVVEIGRTVETSTSIDTDRFVESNKPIETDKLSEPTTTTETKKGSDNDGGIKTDKLTESEKHFKTELLVESNKAIETGMTIASNKPIESNIQPIESNKAGESDTVKSDRTIPPEKAVETEKLVASNKSTETGMTIESYKPIESNIQSNKIDESDTIKSEKVIETEKLVESSKGIETGMTIESNKPIESNKANESDIIKSDQTIPSENAIETEKLVESNESLQAENFIDIKRIIQPIETQKYIINNVIIDESIFEADRGIETDILIEASRSIESDNVVETESPVQPETPIETNIATDIGIANDRPIENDIGIVTEHLSESVKDAKAYRFEMAKGFNKPDEHIETNKIVKNEGIGTDELVKSNAAIVSDSAIDPDTLIEKISVVEDHRVIDSDKFVEPAVRIDTSKISETPMEIRTKSSTEKTEISEADEILEHLVDDEVENEDVISEYPYIGGAPHGQELLQALEIQEDYRISKPEPPQPEPKQPEILQHAEVTKTLQGILNGKQRTRKTKLMSAKVEYEGESPYENEPRELHSFDPLHIDSNSRKMRRKDVLKTPFNPPLNPRVRIPRPPFDAREHEYHTLACRMHRAIPVRMRPHENNVINKQLCSTASPARHYRPLLTILKWTRGARLFCAFQFGMYAALLSKYHKK